MDVKVTYCVEISRVFINRALLEGHEGEWAPLVHEIEIVALLIGFCEQILSSELYVDKTGVVSDVEVGPGMGDTDLRFLAICYINAGFIKDGSVIILITLEVAVPIIAVH